MDELTELIRSEIKNQYGNLQEFCKRTGIKYSTMNSAFHRGISGSSYEFVTKVCKILGLKRLFDDEITAVSREYYDLVRGLQGVDEQGLATIRAIIRVEKERCEGKETVVKAYNGIGYVSGDDHIKQLIREVLAEQK